MSDATDAAVVPTAAPSAAAASGEPVKVWEIVYMCLVLLFMFVALVSDRVGADMVMLAALTLCMAAQIVTVEEGIAGFANEGLLTVLVLFVVAAGISHTGALDWYMGKLLGRPRTIAGAQLRRVLLFTLVAVRPRSRCERRSLRTFSPGVSFSPPTHRFQSRHTATPFNSV